LRRSKKNENNSTTDEEINNSNEQIIIKIPATEKKKSFTKSAHSRHKQKNVENISASEDDVDVSKDHYTRNKEKSTSKRQDEKKRKIPDIKFFKKSTLIRHQHKPKIALEGREEDSTTDEDNIENDEDDEIDPRREKSIKLNSKLEDLTKLTSLASDEDFPATRRRREFEKRNLEGLDSEARHLVCRLRKTKRMIREVDEIDRLRHKVLNELKVKEEMLKIKGRSEKRHFQPNKMFQRRNDEDVLQRMLESLTELRVELPNFVISSSDFRSGSNWDQDALLEALKKLDSI